MLRAVMRVLVAALLLTSGTLHMVSPELFNAQVPAFLPFPRAIIYFSGVIELLLAAGLLLPRFEQRAAIATALFFIVIFPGNVWQAVAQIDAFGLTTDAARLVRLGFQPVLILAVLFGSNVPITPATLRNRSVSS